MNQIEIDLKKEIIPEIGLGGISLGMNIFFLKKSFEKCFTDWNGAIGWSETKKIKFEFYNPFISNYIITYKQTIDIYVNTFLGKVVGLVAKKGYRGKVWNKVSIGCKASTIEDCATRNGFQFDMNNVGLTDGMLHYFSEGVSIKFKVGQSDEDGIDSKAHWNQLMGRRIKSITLWRNDLGVSIGQTDFPEEWIGTAPEKIGLEK